MPTTGTLEDLEQLHAQFAPDQIDAHLDQSLYDVISNSDMDEQLKCQLKCLLTLKRTIRRFRHSNNTA